MQKIVGMPFDEYQELPGLNASRLKLLMRSPWAFNRCRHRDTKATMLGSAIHACILEPHKLLSDYTLWTGGDKRREAAKWKEFQAQASLDGKIILDEKEYAAVKGAHDAVRSHPQAMYYLAHGTPESTLQWHDEEFGIDCKARIDWVCGAGINYLVDLKSTRNSSPEKFGHDAFRLGYHIQLAFYLRGWKAVTGEDRNFAIIAIENLHPFEPAVYTVPPDVVDLGSQEVYRLMNLYKWCEDRNEWPPEVATQTDLVLPRYAYPHEDDDVSDLGLDFGGSDV